MQYVILLKWKNVEGEKITSHSSQVLHAEDLMSAVQAFESDASGREDRFLMSAEIVGVNDGMGSNFKLEGEK